MGIDYIYNCGHIFGPRLKLALATNIVGRKAKAVSSKESDSAWC
jgi:hypothetical protein